MSTKPDVPAVGSKRRLASFPRRRNAFTSSRSFLLNNVQTNERQTTQNQQGREFQVGLKTSGRPTRFSSSRGRTSVRKCGVWGTTAARSSSPPADPNRRALAAPPQISCTCLREKAKGGRDGARRFSWPSGKTKHLKSNRRRRRALMRAHQPL